MLHIPGSSSLQMKMELPVASHKTRCCSTLAQREFILRAVFTSNMKNMFVKTSSAQILHSDYLVMHSITIAKSFTFIFCTCRTFLPWLLQYDNNTS